MLRSCRAGSPERADMSQIIALIKRENQRSQMEVLREERRILASDRNHSMSADKFEKLSSFSISRRSSLKKHAPKDSPRNQSKNVDAQGLTGALLKLQSLSTNKYPEPSNKSDENTSDN